MGLKITLSVWNDFKGDFVVITACGSVHFLQKKHALFFARTRKKQFFDLLNECISTNGLICSTLATCKDVHLLQVVSSSQQSFYNSLDYISHNYSRHYVYLESHLITLLEEVLLMTYALGLKCIYNRVDKMLDNFYSLKYTNFAKSFEIIKRKKYKKPVMLLNKNVDIAV